MGRLGVPVIVHLAATTPAETARSLDLIERAQGVGGIELGLRDDVTHYETGQLVRAALGGPPLLVRLPLDPPPSWPPPPPRPAPTR